MPNSLHELKPRILAVDDDAVARRIFERLLDAAHYHPVVFAEPEEVLAALDQRPPGYFECAILDYSMPGMNGLELLKRIQQYDRTLAAVMITSSEEESLIRDSFRGGVVDFLRKPAGGPELRRSVAEAVLLTRKRRKADETQRGLSQAGKASFIFNSIDGGAITQRITLTYLPRHEVGGDFVDATCTPDGHQHFLLGDVSGHSLKSALISSYFQGMRYGQLRAGVPVDRILADFNQLLVSNWNVPSRGAPRSVPSSLSVCSVDIDSKARTAEVINCGFPGPVFFTRDERAIEPRTLNTPLGWFDGESRASECVDIRDAVWLYGFSDGILDQAAELSINLFSLAFRLQHDRNDFLRDEILQRSVDDIMLLRYSMPTAAAADAARIPLYYARYPGDRLSIIDEIEGELVRSLKFALGGRIGGIIDTVALCCREGLINALRHGCAGSADRECRLQIFWDGDAGSLSCRIDDDGEGHHYDLEGRYRHLREMDEQFEDPGRHLGLVLIHSLANDFGLERRGASLRFGFLVGLTEPTLFEEPVPDPASASDQMHHHEGAVR